MLPYYNDHTIKFSHTPVINKIGFKVNQIGPDDPYVFPAVDYTDTDANTIYVDSAAGNDGNAGTAASPKKTLLAAINATTSTKTKVVALNTAIYNEDISGGTYTYFQGVYNDGTQASSWVGRLLGYTPADANSIFVAKTGDDDDAGTQAAPKLTVAGAIAACDGTHQKVVILDSETYEEEGFEFTGNFTGLYAAIGEAPIIELFRNNNYFTLTSDITDTLFHDAQTGESSCFKLSDGKIFIAYSDISDSRKGKYIVLNSDYSVSVSETVFHNANTYYISGCQLTNSGIIISYTDNSDGDKGKYIVLSFSDYSVIKSETEFHANATMHTNVYQLLSGKIFISYRDVTDAGKGKYIVLNSDYSVSVSETVFDANTVNGICVNQFTNGNIIIVYGDTILNKGMYLIMDSSYAIIVSATEFHNARINFPTIKINTNSQIFITFRQEDVNSRGKYIVLDDGFSEIIGATIFHDALTDGISCEYLDTDKILITYCDTADTNKGKYIVVSPEDQYKILVSSAASLNGVSLTTYDTYYLKTFINCLSTLNVKYCNIYDAISSTENVNCVAISSNSHVDITYSTIHDCDIGIVTTEDTSDFFDSQFYRINEGYAIDVDGAAGVGAGINIEHCDIFDCYGGIRLQNNDGGEVIKNCIIHDCDVYAIYCDTAVTFTNTCYTGSLSGATVGASVVKANPLYLNQGYTDPDDTDLGIKTKVLGYPADSPAKDLADDSRNAGAIDIEYIGTETSWTAITVAKPFSIDVVKEYAGEVNTQRKDGSYSSYKDGQSEVVEMTWKGITNAQYALLEALWLSESSQVRIYPDPTTYPSSYEVYTLLRKPLNDNVKYWQLARTGRQDVKLSFARASS
jgi:hypothetical protein